MKLKNMQFYWVTTIKVVSGTRSLIESLTSNMRILRKIEKINRIWLSENSKNFSNKMKFEKLKKDYLKKYRKFTNIIKVIMIKVIH